MKHIALKPVDNIQRSLDLIVSAYPAIFVSDVAGVVASNGSSVTNSTIGD